MLLIVIIPALFLEILQRYCKLIILGTLGKFGYAHQKQCDQSLENSYVYLETKNQPDPSMIFTGVTFYRVPQSVIG